MASENPRGSVRERAVPKAVLIERTEELLSRFFQRLGTGIYGSSWSPAFMETLKKSVDAESPVGSGEECANLVREQILEGLHTGLLVATVKLAVSVREEIRAQRQSSAYQEDLNNDDDDVISDDGAPKLRKFDIKPDYWFQSNKNRCLDWINSTCEITTNCLTEVTDLPRRSRPVAETFDSIDGARVVLAIKDPDRVIGKLIRHDPLPDEQWLKRYMLYRAQSRPEAIAAGWRHLAMIDGDRKSISATALARVMEEYLEAQGVEQRSKEHQVGEEKSTFEVMAGNMLRQLEAPDRNSSVLVSSSRRARRGG